MLEKRKDLSDKMLFPVASKLKGFDPDIFSWLSLFSGFLAGMFFYFGGFFLLLAALFVIFNSLFDTLDGMLAKISYCSVVVGFFAVVGTVLTSSVGSLGVVSKVGRIKGGLSRADRLLILFIIPIVQFILISFNITLLNGLWFTEWVMLFLAVIANFTAFQRGFVLWKRL
jgi:CDP-diacylglycerol--glycerol-3-phosphate 3-phosphatidyltransferase